MILEHVKIENNKIIIPSKKFYNSNINITKNQIGKCMTFAYNMTFGDKGKHKSASFGNQNYKRDKIEIFNNAFQGKLAEQSIYNFFEENNVDNNPPVNFDCYDTGVWEDVDFQIDNINIAVKSTKQFGNLLLLEKDAYNGNGEYLLTVNGIPKKYDFIFFVRVKGIDKYNIIDYKEIYTNNYTYFSTEISGFITNKMLKNIIKNKNIVEKNYILGTPLKVDNYYICTNDLKSIEDFKNYIK